MSSADNANHGKGGRYGVGPQAPTPSGIMNEGDTAGRVGVSDVGGPSGDITGTQYDRNPRTAGEHQNRGQSDLARPEDFDGAPQSNQPGQHQWVAPHGPVSEPRGADTSPTQHSRVTMQMDGNTCRCPACGAIVNVDAGSIQGKQVWCDGVNHGIG